MTYHRKNTATKYYVSDAQLMEEILISKARLFKIVGNKKPTDDDIYKAVSDNLVNMIYKIVKRYATTGSFVNYTWREDMESAAWAHASRVVLKFDPEKASVNAHGEKVPRPFAYLTQVIKRSLIAYLKSENKQAYTKDIIIEKESMSNPVKSTPAVSYKRQLEKLERDYSGNLLDGTKNPDVPLKSRAGRKPKNRKNTMSHLSPTEYKAWLDKKVEEYYMLNNSNVNEEQAK